jgi:uncharacterized protein (TIGR02246 family)
MATVQSSVQSVFDRYTAAVQASDADSLLALYADDVHVYDLMAPFERHGKESGREMIAAWLGNKEEKQSCTIEDLHVDESGDLAVARASVRYEVNMPDGTHHGMWNRATWALRRIEGEWKIVMEHTSVPLGAEDMQPVFEREGKS